MTRVILALALAATLVTPAIGRAAGVLYTVHPNYFPEDLRVDCLAQNFNTSTQTATVDGLDIVGQVVVTSGAILVAPGGITGVAATGPGTAVISCRYTVGGSVKKWRATGIVTTAGSPYTLRAYVEGK
jgi:hypothetical protein